MMYYALAILNLLFAASAQMCLKKSAQAKHETKIKEYLNLWVFIGYSLMGLSLLGNIFVMSKGIQIKELGALGSLNNLFIPLMTFFIFKEKISKKKIQAISLIILGTIIFYW